MVLTLDAELQEVVERVVDTIMTRHRPVPGAGAVVLEADTGEILALVSRPEAGSMREWPFHGHGQLSSYPWMVPLTYAVPPGSTFKPLTVGGGALGTERGGGWNDTVDCGQPAGTFVVRSGLAGARWRNYKNRRHASGQCGRGTLSFLQHGHGSSGRDPGAGPDGRDLFPARLSREQGPVRACALAVLATAWPLARLHIATVQVDSGIYAYHLVVRAGNAFDPAGSRVCVHGCGHGRSTPGARTGAPRVVVVRRFGSDRTDHAALRRCRTLAVSTRGCGRDPGRLAKSGRVPGRHAELAVSHTIRAIRRPRHGRQDRNSHRTRTGRSWPSWPGPSGVGIRKTFSTWS